MATPNDPIKSREKTAFYAKSPKKASSKLKIAKKSGKVLPSPKKLMANVKRFGFQQTS
jgi:hypothetical protein